jgi:cytochrome c oxidase, subunit II
MYYEASNFVQGVDSVFKLILGISFFFLIGITAVIIIFIIKYNKKKHPKAEQIPNNTALEITWTVIPLILVLVMFYYGYMAFLPMRKAPKDAMVVKTTGRMWTWDFEYPNGKHSPELVVPLKKAVRLDMTSKDVIHGMFIPAFRLKEDVIPGKQTLIWFIPELEGSYEIFCSAYCGIDHSTMQSAVKVIPEAEFNKWLVEKPKVEVTAQAGQEIIKRNACTSCHSLDGSKIIGPSFKGLFGSKHVVVTDDKEREITADTSYIHTSIIDPDKDVVKGFNKGMMRSYQGVVSDDDIKSIIEYLKTLK